MMLGVRTAAWAESVGTTPQEYGGLKFTAEASDCSVSLSIFEGNPYPISLMSSVDNGLSWKNYNIGDAVHLISNGSTVMFKSAPSGNEGFSKSVNDFYHFNIIGDVSISGDISSLLNENLDSKTNLKKWTFWGLFAMNTSIVSAKELILSHLSVGISCYYEMFVGCSNLLYGPDIRATTVGTNAFEEMFSDCSSLKEIRIAYTGVLTNLYCSCWSSGVPKGGTIYYSGPTMEQGDSAIPIGWTKVPYEPIKTV